MNTLERLKQTQFDDNPICPRCGRPTMKPGLTHNAISRVADLYVCEACGMDEALRDFTGMPVPIDDWFLPKLWKAAD